jgi:iron complex outermembrane recepter protein
MKKTYAHFLAGISVLAIATSPAFAQEKAMDASPIEDIIVTAQKRAENSQSVPISIAAVTGKAVAELHAVTLQGLQGTVPNISLGNFSNTPNNAVIAIRGIGIIEPDPYAGNTVGIVTDGVPQFFSMGALLDLYDVERIEILRGPQGTLFGANTTGGVVNVVNAQPTSEFGGHVDASYGNYNHITIGGVVNAPLSDKAAARFSVSHDQRKGWVTNVVDGSDMGRRNVTVFRGAVKLSPGDDFDATLSGEYDRARNGAPIVVAGDLPGEAEFVPAGVQNMYVSPCLPAGSRCVAPDHYFSALKGVPDQSDMDTYRGTLTMNARNTAAGDVTSITSYKKFKLFEFTDQDGTPLFLDDTRRQTRGWQFSQELRTDVHLNDMIELLVGGFYMKTHYDHYQHFRIEFAAPGLFQRNLQDQDNNSISGFAQAYITLSDKLRAQAGIRYTHEKTSMIASTATSIALGGVTTFDGTAPNGTPNFDLGTAAASGSKSWNNTGWKVGLDYKVTDAVLLYTYWARGFKSGGFVGRIGIPDDIGPYAPEHVDTIEIGMKGDFLDKRLRVNIAAFTTSYRDMQLAQIYFKGSGASLVQGNTIINAASSRIKGFETEVTAGLADGLTLTGSLAYLSAKYSRFPFLLPSGAILDLSGKRLQNAPKWSGAIGANYEFPISDMLKGQAKLQYNFTSEKLLTSIVDTRRASVQPQKLLNANFDLLINDNMQVGVYATNLFDKRYLNSVFDAVGTLGLANYAPPRQWGISSKYNF